MHVSQNRNPQEGQHRSPATSIELLEDRRLMSAAVLTAADTTDTTVPSPVTAFDITATERKKFRDIVGNWTVDGGVPTRASGIAALAIVDWGDGKTSHGKLVDDGSGVVQILASHTWSKPGAFQTKVTIEEFPRKHKHDITEIGQGAATATVAVKPHKVSVKGTLTGTYTLPLGNPDARSFQFTGNGTVKTLGAVAIDGTITPPGFIKSAPATGDLTLTAPNGSVTLELTGHPQIGGSPVPQKMTYTISGGTGDFANSGGKGSVAIALDDTASTFVFVIH